MRGIKRLIGSAMLGVLALAKDKLNAKGYHPSVVRESGGLHRLRFLRVVLARTW